MSAELIPQPSLTYPLRSGQIEGLLSHGDRDGTVYREAGNAQSVGRPEWRPTSDVVILAAGTIER